MTEAELQEIERKLERSAYDMEGCEISPIDVRALIAEVRRLRAEVREAHGLLPELPEGGAYTTSSPGVISGSLGVTRR